MASNYAKKIAQLSGKIFMDVGYKPTAHISKIVKLFREKPHQQIIANWYPPVEELDLFFKHLRKVGLYRDEHQDFKDEIQRLKELRGKAKKPKPTKTK